MDFKKEIEKHLESLKLKGFSRADIEGILIQSSNWIDQVLARGGNKSAYNKIKRLDETAIAKSNTAKKIKPVADPPAVLPVSASASDLMALLIENAASLKAALEVHAQMISKHGEVTKANLELAAANHLLAEAAKSQIERSNSLRLDGDTIIPPDLAKQRSGLRSLMKETLKTKKRKHNGNPRIAGQ